MFVLGLGIECVARISAYFPFWSLAIVELIGDVIVGAFGGLFAEAVDHCHFLGDELFGLCIAGGSSEGKLRSGAFLAVLHLPEGRVDLGIGELNQVLVGVYLLLLLLLRLRSLCHQ